MTNEDTIRAMEKALDVLQMVERAMQAEAEMNAAKHMAPVVRPVPLAAAVSTQVADLQSTIERLSL